MAKSSDINFANIEGFYVSMESAKRAYEAARATAEAASITARNATKAYYGGEISVKNAIEANEAFLCAYFDAIKAQQLHHGALGQFLKESNAAPDVIDSHEAMSHALTAIANRVPEECRVLGELYDGYDASDSEVE